MGHPIRRSHAKTPHRRLVITARSKQTETERESDMWRATVDGMR